MNSDNRHLDFYNSYIKKFEPKELQLLKKAEAKAYELMKPDDIHGIGHVLRVLNNCRHIVMEEEKRGAKFNYFVVFFSAWLHDIGRPKEKEMKKNHAIISVDLTKSFITEENLEISPEITEKILECIKSHSFSNGETQESLEAKILSDADKLDAIGSVGIYRASWYQTNVGTGTKGLFEHYSEKLSFLDSKMHTEPGKKFSIERQKIMKDFIDNLKKELS